jgi:hypothetical protein
MLLEVRPASRKTPQDGRFEIGDQTARRLSALGDHFAIELGAESDTAYVERMPCTCNKANSSGSHEHIFLVSPILRTAQPERVYVVELDERGVVVLTGAHGGLQQNDAG